MNGVLLQATDTDRTIERRIIQVGTQDKEPQKPTKPTKADIKAEKKNEVEYEYYDPGNHWCPKCNQVYAGAAEFFEHLHEPKHKAVSNIIYSLIRK